MRAMPTSTTTALRARVKKLRGRYPELIRRSGISRSWISKFAAGVKGKRTSFDLMSRLLTTLDAMEREAGRSGNHGKCVHARAQQRPSRYGNSRTARKTGTRKKRG